MDQHKRNGTDNTRAVGAVQGDRRFPIGTEVGVILGAHAHRTVVLDYNANGIVVSVACHDPSTDEWFPGVVPFAALYDTFAAADAFAAEFRADIKRRNEDARKDAEARLTERQRAERERLEQERRERAVRVQRRRQLAKELRQLTKKGRPRGEAWALDAVCYEVGETTRDPDDYLVVDVDTLERLLRAAKGAEAAPLTFRNRASGGAVTATKSGNTLVVEAEEGFALRVQPSKDSPRLCWLVVERGR